jgi:hypothetical protein
MRTTFIFLFLLNVSSFTFMKDGLSHQCLPKQTSTCTKRALLCPPGYIDGCLSGETTEHQCVLNYDGPSCQVPMDLNCPKNFQDGCLTNQTDSHECIPKKGPSCEKEMKFSCPMNFKDACL